MHSALGTAEFSSLAYMIDLCRIVATFVMACHNTTEDKNRGVFERTDSLLCEFILKLPAWKVDLVNPEGSADIVLQQTIGMAHK